MFLRCIYRCKYEGGHQFMTILITGGKSPIALAIANRISEREETFLMTREIFDKDEKDLNTKVNIVEVNLLEEQSLKIFESLFNNNTINGIIFTHRYRESNPDPLRQYVIEVIRPFEIIEMYSKMYSNDIKKVVLISSPAAELVINDQDFYYHANKSALKALSKYASVKFGARGIRCNTITPGSFIYKDRAKDFYNKNEELVKSVKKITPAGEFGYPEDIADGCNFFIFDASKFITGTNIDVSGGLNLIEQSNFVRNLD